MKRLFFFFLALALILSFAACRRIDDGEETGTAEPSANAVSEPETTAEATSAYTADTQPLDPLPSAGIYEMTGYTPGVREEYTLISTYDDDLSAGVDICVLSAFPATEEKLSGATFADVYSSALAYSPEAKDLKLGYIVSYEANGAAIENRILSPEDIDAENLHYLEIYLYDDVHQAPGAWYSHLLASEMTDETLMTSVKLTPGKDFSAVGNLKLSVFLYSADRQGEPYSVEIHPNDARYR